MTMKATKYIIASDPSDAVGNWEYTGGHSFATAEEAIQRLTAKRKARPGKWANAAVYKVSVEVEKVIDQREEKP